MIKHNLQQIFQLTWIFVNYISNNKTNYIITIFINLQFLFKFNMEGLRRQNEQMQKAIENYLEEIEKQKQLNAQHQTQIQTLLKFNERLLSIIEQELNHPRKQRDSLQPISERSQRQSDMIIGPIQSFIKARKFGPKSQRGSGAANSLLAKAENTVNKLEFYGRDMQSELNHSSHDDHSEYQPAAPSALAIQANKTVESSTEIKKEMLKEIQELKEFKNKSTEFYDNKISEIKNLSVKINKYKPIDHLKQINSKLNISSNTANLLKKIINKPQK